MFANGSGFRAASGRWLAGTAALAAALLACQAPAATVQVQLQDGAAKPLSDGVVFLESREARNASRPLAGAELAQVGKQFVPRVSIITVGTALHFPNRDTVRHHVYSFSPVKTFELKLYTGSAANPVLFDRSGIAVLGCNIHDNMVAWVVVVETPYYGRSGADGQVVLGNVPPGSYRLRAWHPALPVGAPALDQPLTVGPEPAGVSLRLPVTP